MFEFDDDMETGIQKIHPKPAPSPYDDLYDFEEMPYIHHFVSGDGATSSHGKLPGSKGAAEGHRARPGDERRGETTGNGWRR